MITLISTYNNRKDEIEKVIKLMDFLQKKKDGMVDGEISFDDFFYNDSINIDLTFQELINILKSNVTLMIYNLIEFTVSGLLDCIYDKIRTENLSYVDVNEYIRKIWRKNILKAAKDPNANFNTFMVKNEELIDYIIYRETLNIRVRDSMPIGNLDGIQIKSTLELHGIHISTDSTYYRPDILSNIKNSRNSLAHGSVSFVEAMRNNTISDFQQYESIVTSFLQELIATIADYINNKKYKV